MAAVVDHCECLLVGPWVLGDSTLKAVEKPFSLWEVEVFLFDDINERIEVVSLDVLSEDFHIFLDFW